MVGIKVSECRKNKKKNSMQPQTNTNPQKSTLNTSRSIITLDFETFYDKTYSIKKCTTEEYIRDSRFEVIVVAVKLVLGAVVEEIDVKVLLYTQ